jgi:diaminopimelate epimerase
VSFAEEKPKLKMNFLLPFEKLHGLGNDFIIVNANHLRENLNEDYEMQLCKSICERHRGIGADGLIIIDTVKKSDQAIRSWRYYNSDGSIAEMCGNGIRCAAKYIYEHGLSNEETVFKIETLAGDIEVELLDNEMVRVNMGAPKSIEMDKKLIVRGFEFNYDFISMGNPHAVAFFEKDLDVSSKYGSEIEIHSNFPNRTNVEFAKMINPRKIDLIVWERGCGFTEACGTGACATVIAAAKRSLVDKDEEIEVRLPGGSLWINWDSITETVFMKGPAELSFVGYYNE